MTKIPSPFYSNDWNIKATLGVAVFIQLSVWCFIGLDIAGVHIPVARELATSIYLLFVPGILMLRVLRVHDLHPVESLLYAVGISLGLVMLCGLALNSVSTYLSKPISLMPLMYTLGAVVFALCLLAYVRDRTFSSPHLVDLKDPCLSPALMLCLLPFIAIFGTHVFNVYDSNVVLLFLLLIIGAVLVLVGLNRPFPARLYPLTIYVISVALVFHTSLISAHLWGWDIQWEYSYAHATIESGVWNTSDQYGVGSMLSVVMLPPIFSLLSGMELTWIFKIIYPLLFSLVPLGLYRVYQKQTSEKVAVLSCLLLMSIYTFYTEMLQLARQEIAELFLVVFLLVLINRDLNGTVRTGLLIFSASAVMLSHYGTAYLLLFLLVGVCCALFISERLAVRQTTLTLMRRARSKATGFDVMRKSSKVYYPTSITLAFILLFAALTFMWYAYTSDGANLSSLLSMGGNVQRNLQDFANPQTTQAGFYAVTSAPSKLHDLARYLMLTFQFFIVVGVMGVLLKRATFRFQRDYLALAGASFGLLGISLVVPYLASALNTTRLFHLSLIFLAPFGLVGTLILVEELQVRFKVQNKLNITQYAPAVFAILLVLLFQFNNGFVYELTKDDPQSFALNKSIPYPIYNEKEYTAAQWLMISRQVPSAELYLPIFADENHYQVFWGFGIASGNWTTDYLYGLGHSYVFLGSYNMIHSNLQCNYQAGALQGWNTPSVAPLVNGKNKLYDDGGATVYL